MLITVEKVEITNRFEKDPEMEEHVESYATEFNAKLERVIGYTDIDLEGRFQYLRSEETNLANWISDLTLTEYDNVDICLLNSGTLRSNCIIPKGEITAKMIANLLPQGHKMLILKVPGWIVKELLENSVYAYPMLDGRFSTFAGVRFSFDPDEPAGSRVFDIADNEKQPLDLNREYTVAMSDFISTGGDGFEVLRLPSVVCVRDIESATML